METVATWVLVIFFHGIGGWGGIGAVAIDKIEGFSSKEFCEEARKGIIYGSVGHQNLNVTARCIPKK